MNHAQLVTNTLVLINAQTQHQTCSACCNDSSLQKSSGPGLTHAQMMTSGAEGAVVPSVVASSTGSSSVWIRANISCTDTVSHVSQWCSANQPESQSAQLIWSAIATACKLIKQQHWQLSSLDQGQSFLRRRTISHHHASLYFPV